MYIETINSPQDLKMLSVDECRTLADEIRNILICKASKVGGHLGSNLGVIEATIALHYVFESPKDKIIFDVSHQCYTHKILTGRKNAFIDPNKYNTVSGYTCPEESEHDNFQVGHTATSISLASGMAKSRDLNGERYNVIAFIGDGSLSGGEALEGLDFAGSELRSNFIVVFNDNQMSIAENHGGIYQHLTSLRKTKGKAENNIFRAFGYDYYYVEEGNCLEELIDAFKKVKDTDHPIVIHICTKKGNGYNYAEINPEECHWVRPFDISIGPKKNPPTGERYDVIIRDFLIQKMKNDMKVATIIAAVPDSLSFLPEKRAEIGKQFIDCGIAEEHAIALAAGMAKNGAKPIFATFSSFFQRTYDQINQEMCINNCPATLIVINASVYAVNDVTHVGIFDIPLLGNIPNLVYLAPTNKEEYLAMLDWSIEQDKFPVAVRAPRNGVYHSKCEVDVDYSELNKFMIAQQGNRVAIIALGDFFQMGERVIELLEEHSGLKATLINPRYISGIDQELLQEIAENHEVIVTLEDGILEGGFGEKIASFFGKDRRVAVLNYGLRKEFLDRYDLEKVMQSNRLVPEMIAEDIEMMLH